VTVPLTLLQKNLIQFYPPLPERKLKAIHSLGAGIIEKVVVVVVVVVVVCLSSRGRHHREGTEAGTPVHVFYFSEFYPLFVLLFQVL